MNIDEMKMSEKKLLDVITLGTLLNDLSPIDRQLMTDYYVLDLSLDEMAQKYDASKATIIKRLKRIVKRLQAIS